MSSKTHNQSDSEDDTEYVPPTYEQPSSDSDNESQTKSHRAASPTPGSEAVEIGQKDRDTLWTNFKASSSKLTPAKAEEKKMIKIEKKYLFAGEYITEIVEVPEDSPEAKEWPLHASDIETVNIPQETSTTSTIPPTSVATAPSKTSSKKPGPRKSKKVLSSLPSSSAQKAKKLTTLDKSLMDWKAHTGDQALQDELDTNRRSGGYLEKVEFLQRVEDRKEENLESLKSRKRRKL